MPETTHETDGSPVRRPLQRQPLLIALLVALAVALMAAVSAQGAAAPARWIVFTATPPGVATGQLFRVRTTGRGLSQLTTGSLAATSPAFSPDGKRIVFARPGAGLFSMDVDGKGLRRLTRNDRDSYPTWSSDGKQIAFVRPYETRWRVHVMSAKGAGQRLLAKSPPAGRPSWIAGRLLIPAAGDVVEIDPVTGSVRKYLDVLIDPVFGLDSVEISPDLSTLMYVGIRPSDPGDMDCGEGPCQRYALYIEDILKSRTPRLLTADVGPAAFSPDGKSVAFAAKNGLVLRSLTDGSSKLISTGKAYISVVAPPAWQRR